MRLAVVLALMLLAGCGEDDAGDTVTTTTAEVPATTGAPEPALLPGLAPVDVYGNLEDRGWACDGPDDRVFSCTLAGSLSEVTIVTSSGADVVSVEGEVYGPDDYLWLEFLATVPFDRADPEGAQAWVRDNVAVAVDEVESFGGVPFRLSGEGEFRGLTIGG